MQKLLLLVHRIPYPPNKGDKIRSYHLLKYLATRYEIFLASFVDDKYDWRFRDEVSRLCTDVFLRPLNPRTARLRSLAGLFTGEPLSLPYFQDWSLGAWVRKTIKAEKIQRIMVYSSSMAQYVDSEEYAACRRVLDFVDVDSDKWRQYAGRHVGPMAWVYRRESRYLLQYERGLASRFNASLFVSDAEASLFRRLAPETAAKVSHYDNGVDTVYFDPELVFDSPYEPGGPVLVFTGAMDYWANIEAVQWFCDQVLPHIRSVRSDVRFFIVGSNPPDVVLSLAKSPSITVTGRVEDVRPYLRHAALAVAPLRIARGIQNKVLEALAMGRTTLCTPAAAEGLCPQSWLDACIHEDAKAFADAVIEHLDDGPNLRGRAYVKHNYSWDTHLQRVERLLD